jgi:hypothetical protein
MPDWFDVLLSASEYIEGRYNMIAVDRILSPTNCQQFDEYTEGHYNPDKSTHLQVNLCAE